MERVTESTRKFYPKPRLVHSLMGPGLSGVTMVLIFASFFLLFAMLSHERTTQAWHDEVREMQVKGSFFHFVFEARLRGEEIPHSEDPWEILAAVRLCVKSLLEGQSGLKGRAVEPLEDPLLIETVELLSGYLANIESIGRSIEQQAPSGGFSESDDDDLDHAIHRFLHASQRLEMQVTGMLVRSHRNIEIAFIVIIAGWIFLVSIALLGLRFYERSRRRTERALFRAKTDWERTFDAVPDLIAVLDTDCRILRVNRAMAQRLGLKEADAIGRRFHEIVHGTDDTILGCPATLLLADAQSRTTEVYEKNFGGHFLITASPVTDADGILVGSIHIARDVTGRKKVEHALQGRLKELKCLYDISSTMERGNVSIEEIVQYALEAIPLALQHPEDAAARIVFRGLEFQTPNYRPTPWKLVSTLYVREIDAGMIEVCCLTEKKTGDGDPFHKEERNFLEGVARMVAGLVERKEAEEALHDAYKDMEQQVIERTLDLRQTVTRLSEKVWELQEVQRSLSRSQAEYRTLSQEFHGLLDAIQDILLLIAPNHKVIWANRGASEQLGLKVEELTNQKCCDLIHEAGGACVRCPIDECFEGGKPHAERTVSRRGRLVELRAFGIPGENGRPVNVILSGHDVTEMNTLQNEAIRSAQLASLGQLAAGVAHEINNPINGIINYAQIVANDSPPDTETHGFAQRIIKESDRVATIVRSLLSFARERKEERELTTVSEILSDTMGLIGSQLKKNGIRLTVDVPENLPPVHVSFQKIQQIFLNILGNGQHALNERYPYADENKIIEIRAKVVTRDGRNYVRTLFRDHGVGIRAENIDRILQPFVTTKPPGMGTGLGLSISRDIVHAHGGLLSINSRFGEFTEALVDLPVSEV